MIAGYWLNQAIVKAIKDVNAAGTREEMRTALEENKAVLVPEGEINDLMAEVLLERRGDGYRTLADILAVLKTVSEEPEEATFEATGDYVIQNNIVCALYELKDKDGAQIPLTGSNIASISVKTPDGRTIDLTELLDADPYLGLNIAIAAGTYTFTVETKAGVTYEAAIEW